jgi:hypothetical protein
MTHTSLAINICQVAAVKKIKLNHYFPISFAFKRLLHDFFLAVDYLFFQQKKRLLHDYFKIETITAPSFMPSITLIICSFITFFFV